MKVVGQLTESAACFSSSFKKTGHEWFWWMGNKPAFDIMDELKPDIVLTHGEPPGLKKALQEYTDTKWIDCKNLPESVDYFVYKPVESDPALECDLCYIGPMCAPIKYLCWHLSRKINIKCTFDKPLSVPQYIGALEPHEVLRLYSSAKMCYCDTVVQALRAIACNCTPITTNSNVFERFPNTVVFYSENDISTITGKHGPTNRDEILPQASSTWVIAQQLKDLGLHDEAESMVELIDD